MPNGRRSETWQTRFSNQTPNQTNPEKFFQEYARFSGQRDPLTAPAPRKYLFPYPTPARALARAADGLRGIG